MLPKGRKLNAEDLKILRNMGKRVHTTLFSVVYWPAAPGLKEARFAVSVPKKVYKKAVDRNRAKRRVLSILAGINAKLGWYEFMIKNPLNSLPYKDIKEEIEKICQK